jgi:hypothetical protein
MVYSLHPDSYLTSTFIYSILIFSMLFWKRPIFSIESGEFSASEDGILVNMANLICALKPPIFFASSKICKSLFEIIAKNNTFKLLLLYKIKMDTNLELI